jgi:hypothetical protein
MRTWLVAAIVAVIPLGRHPCTSRATESYRQERATFAKGASSATIKGQLKGDETVDYVLRASAGQTLTVTLKTSHGANYYNVLPPDSTDVAMFIGQFGGDFKSLLPTDGDYTIRVYLMRSAARRNESSDYTLTISVTGKPLVAVPASQDAVIPGTPYHAKHTADLCRQSICRDETAAMRGLCHPPRFRRHSYRRDQAGTAKSSAESSS